MEWDFLWILLLLLANGFFVAAEFAIVKVRASQLEIKEKTGARTAKTAKNILNNANSYLAASQLGITLSSIALGWVGGLMMTDMVISLFSLFTIEVTTLLARNISIALAFAIITSLHIVLGELVPKAVAIHRPVTSILRIALLLRLFYILFKPIIWILNGLAYVLLRILGIRRSSLESNHSSEELQYLLERGKESGALDVAEHELIRKVFDFNDRIAKNIMIPRNKISAVEMSCPTQEVIKTITEEGYSRIPIYQEDIDQIIGIIHSKDILPIVAQGKELALKSIIRKPYFIPETKKINELMTEFQQRRIQIAIVLDEFGGTAGMITLEDIMEELVGEIQDEYDEETPIVEKISDTEYIVEASANVHDANEFLPVALPESNDYDTISGLVSDLFDKIPDVGEHKLVENYNIIIMKKSQQNIDFIKLELVDTEHDDEED